MLYILFRFNFMNFSRQEYKNQSSNQSSIKYKSALHKSIKIFNIKDIFPVNISIANQQVQTFCSQKRPCIS